MSETMEPPAENGEPAEEVLYDSEKDGEQQPEPAESSPVAEPTEPTEDDDEAENGDEGEGAA